MRTLFIFWKIYSRFIIGLIVLSIIFSFVINSMSQVGGSYFPQHFDNVFFLARESYYFGLLILSALLGYLFNSRQPRSWLRQLPISGREVSLFPQIVILGLAIIIYFLHRKIWNTGYLHEGTSFSLLFILAPLTMFYLAKTRRRFWVGCILGAVAIQIYLVIWSFLFHRWAIYQSQLVMELSISFLAFLTVALLEADRRINSLATLVIAFGLWGGVGTYKYIREPKDLQTAISDVKYFPSERSIDRFKKAATTPSYWSKQPAIVWSDIESYHLFGWGARFGHKYLNLNERIKVVELIRQFWENFSHRDREVGYITSYPYSSYNTPDEEPLQKYFLTHWEKDPLFCELTPILLTHEYLDRVFQGPCGMATILFEHYSPIRKRPYDTWLEEKLLKAHNNASTEMKGALSRLFWAYAEDREDDYSSIKGHWFELNSLTPEKLAEWKKNFLRPEREQLEKILSLPYDQYLKAIKALPSGTREEKMRTQRLLNYLIGQLGVSTSEFSDEIDQRFAFYWSQFWNDNGDDKFIYFRKYLVTRPEQWQKAQVLKGKLL